MPGFAPKSSLAVCQTDTARIAAGIDQLDPGADNAVMAATRDFLLPLTISRLSPFTSLPDGRRLRLSPCDRKKPMTTIRLRAPLLAEAAAITPASRCIAAQRVAMDAACRDHRARTGRPVRRTEHAAPPGWIGQLAGMTRSVSASKESQRRRINGVNDLRR